jgi:hypothetical protein
LLEPSEQRGETLQLCRNVEVNKIPFRSAARNRNQFRAGDVSGTLIAETPMWSPLAIVVSMNSEAAFPKRESEYRYQMVV